MKNLTLLLIVLFTVNITFSQIINIPGDYPTIQQGIDAASSGDTVLVAPGIYFENIDYSGKNITLTSNFVFTNDNDDILNTIIDGSDSASVVTFKNDEDSTALLLGFTIQNGMAENGGGIMCYGSNLGPSPTLRNLIVKNNYTTLYTARGGGIFCHNSAALIANCRIENNTSKRGGGISFQSTSTIGDEINAKIVDCIIKNNDAHNEGGAISVENTNIEIINTSCNYNVTSWDWEGGALWVSSCKTVNISNSIFNNNYAGIGGGMFAGGCESVTVENSTFSNNNVLWSGGGIASSGSCIILKNILMVNNDCSDYESLGAAIYGNYSDFNIINSTFADNSSSYPIMYLEGSDCEMVNCICPSDYEDQGLIRLGRVLLSPCYISFSHCNIANNAIHDFTNGSEILFLEGNINEDPEFVEIGPNPYQITATSPCADAGTSDTTGLNLPEFDLADNPRINNIIVDMGAYEWDITVGKLEFLENITHLIVYPNPAQNKITISTNNNAEISQLYIYNQLGQKVLQLENPLNTIDISDIGKGLFVVELISTGNKFRSKLIKN